MCFSTSVWLNANALEVTANEYYSFSLGPVTVGSHTVQSKQIPAALELDSGKSLEKAGLCLTIKPTKYQAACACLKPAIRVVMTETEVDGGEAQGCGTS